MCHQARLRLLMMLLLAGIPAIVNAQPHERFSVEPSDPGVLSGAGFLDEEFTFIADVTDADDYEMQFQAGGDFVEPDEIDSTRRAIWRHRYTSARTYTATMRATRAAGESPIVLALNVVVKRRPTPPPPVAAKARFLVEPADAESCPDIRVPWAGFRFTGYVTGAESYALYFGDDAFEQDISPNEYGEVIRCHEYPEESPEVYTAVMRAWNNTGEPNESVLFVQVQKPPEPPSAPVVVPRVDPPLPRVLIPPPPPSLPWWVLPLAVFASMLGTSAFMPRPELIRFRPRVHLGTVKVVGAATADEAVSLRVRRDPGRIVILKDEGEKQ